MKAIIRNRNGLPERAQRSGVFLASFLRDAGKAMISQVLLRWYREFIAIIVAAVVVGLAIWLIHNGLVAVHAAP